LNHYFNKAQRQHIIQHTVIQLINITMKSFSAIVVTLALQLLSFSALAQNEGQVHNVSRRIKSTKGPKSGIETETAGGTKLTKGSKSGKGKKSKSKSLVALVGNPTTGGFGTVTLRYNGDGSFLVALGMNKLPANTEGTAVITEGTSCEAPLNKTPFTSADKFDGSTNHYGVLGNGISMDAFRFNNGKTFEENCGKTVILYDNLNVNVGCGVLEEESMVKILEADIETYPGYTGDFSPKGTVKVSFFHDDTFRFHYDFSGTEQDCSDCGIHIHEGVSCANALDVKGHGFNSVLVHDLWTVAGGAFYNADSSGNAEGYFSMFTGYGYEESYHHAVVIHNSGDRIGCGILK